MPRAPLHIAVVGLGRMGQIYARVVAEQRSEARLYALVEPNEQRRTEWGAALGVPHVLAAAEDALALPELDAVIIATPTSTHRDLVVTAAKAGKAIFCEKPLALSLDATRAMLAAVDRAGVLLQVGFMRRFDAAYQKAKAYIERGLIGQPLTFKSIGRDPFCPRPAYADPAHSGGLIVDMGIHDFDAARWLMGGEIERVTAEGTLMVCDTLRAVGDIDNAVINLRFENGALGNVEVSRNACYGYDIRAEVLGSSGTLRIGGEQQANLMLLTREGSQHHDGSYLMDRFGDAYRMQLRHFVTCLLEDSPPAVTGADALAAFEVSLAARYATQTGQPVTLAAVRAGWTPNVATD